MTEKYVAKWGLGAIVLVAMVFASNAASVPETNSGRVVKENPIVINTVAQHYQNPTLGEYQLCTRSRDDCLSKCGNFDETCRGTCPVCPVLIDQDVLVQGINDTLYRLPITSGTVNQTNIIRLTNEIRNIIESNLGNITTNNQNNINVYHNTSKTGGRFGLGWTENGPCCHVIQSNQRCQRSVTGQKCSHRRQRICGSQCISRVVRSTPVVTCSETNPAECSTFYQYKAEPLAPGCQYSERYPYINCNSAKQRSVASRSSRCGGCYNIPYYKVVRGEIPPSCGSCFSAQNRRPVNPSPFYQRPPQYSYYGQSNYYDYVPFLQMRPQFSPDYRDSWFLMPDEDNEIDQYEPSHPGPEWKVDQQKCVSEDGTVLENCSPNADGSEDTDTVYDYYEGAESIGPENYEQVPTTPRRRSRRRVN